MTIAQAEVLPNIGAYAVRAGWDIATIGELFSIQQGKALSAAARTASSRFPFLRTANVLWGNLDLTKVDRMGLSDVERAKLRLARGDLLVCEGGEIGRAAIWDGSIEECYFQNHIHRLRPLREDVNPSFYAYWLQLAFTRLGVYEGAGTKTTIANLSRGRLANLLVPVPPLEEQRRIARILSTIQRVAATRKSQIVSVTELRRSLIEDFFSEADRVVLLSSLIERPQYGFTASASNNGPVRFLRITDIQEWGIDWNTVPSCDPLPPAGGRYELTDGDLVVARIGATTGKAWLISNPPASVFASYLIRIRARSEVDPRFLGAFFESRAYWSQIDSAKGGRLKGGVNIENLNSLHVPYLPPATQLRLGQSLDAIALARHAGWNSASATSALFDSAMATLLGSVP